ncbi:MAG: sigma-54 dependent transcriptional regulator [candidate division Zixibacteria bacterium]|nr:sigma-54 dependent transcriptional regulator [candidate division Zixibacteria bacterium]
MSERVLIIDDEPGITRSFSSLLGDEGYLTVCAGSGDKGIAALRKQRFDLVLLDLNMSGMSGLDFLRALSDIPVSPAVLVVSGQSDIPTALEAIKLGAVDYLEKPAPPEKLLASVRSALLLATANRQRMILVGEMESESQIIGHSPTVEKLLTAVTKAAPTDAGILVTGENGTGKELVAMRLFLQSHRCDQPFIKVNCPGIPTTLFESELFGHTKGAFTGAVKDHPGKFILADGGTLFLDEIGDLPIECQAKLLRVIETGEVERLGETEARLVDVRLVCATNRDLKSLISEGRFREDLFYRISVVTIEVPPLRSRREDIPLLTGEFLRRFDPGGSCRLSPEAMAYLTTLDYPGNIRQLKNMIERLTIFHRDRTVTVDDLLDMVSSAEEDVSMSLADRLTGYEKQLLSAMLVETKGNISEAARRLGMDRANLSRKIKEFGLKKP